MTFEKYQLWDAQTQSDYASARLYLAESLFNYCLNHFPDYNDKVALRTVEELLEYRFTSNDEGMSYSVENGVLYAVCSWPKEFWRVPLEVNGLLANMADVDMSEVLSETLKNRTEVSPVRLTRTDYNYFYVFEGSL